MSMVFVNFPVSDLARATAFYEKLGFKKNEMFSNDVSSSMVWDDNFYIMLLKHEFYSKFIGERTIADAKENGGNVYQVDMGIPEDQMYGLEVQDPDGNMLEPNWMPA